MAQGKRTPIMDRINAKRVYEDRGYQTLCRVFKGSKNNQGYPLISGFSEVDDRPTIMLVHRVVYADTHGLIECGLTVDHLCFQPDCSEITHLEAVTVRENILRSNSFSAINARKTHCPQSHEYTSENTIVSSAGKRYCRACRREHQRGREYQLRANARRRALYHSRKASG